MVPLTKDKMDFVASDFFIFGFVLLSASFILLQEYPIWNTADSRLLISFLCLSVSASLCNCVIRDFMTFWS